MSPFACDPLVVQRVKDALQINDLNIGVGILHLPTVRIFLTPMDDLPNKNGHGGFVTALGLLASECKGFQIGKLGQTFVPANVSHLNGPQGLPGSLLMPAPLFADIIQALQAAGL